MKTVTHLSYSRLIERYPLLSSLEREILKAINCLLESYKHGNKLLVAGNGGSSADAEHLCGELNKSFVAKRELEDQEKEAFSSVFPDFDPLQIQGALPAIPLGSFHSTISAISNDLSWEYAFAQSLYSLGKEGDVFIGISTSGESQNIIRALQVAKISKIKSIVLTGQKDSSCSKIADISLQIPSVITHEIQELHLPIYHALCLELENYFWGSTE